MIKAFLLYMLPDPEFFDPTNSWVWLIAALAAIVGLVIYFIRKKNKARLKRL